MKKKKAPVPASVQPSEDAIRCVAYELYVESGCVDGNDVENWLEAEVLLCTPPKKSKTRRTPHQPEEPIPEIALLASLDSRNMCR